MNISDAGFELTVCTTGVPPSLSELMWTTLSIEDPPPAVNPAAATIPAAASILAAAACDPEMSLAAEAERSAQTADTFTCGIHLKIFGRAIGVDLSSETDFLASVECEKDDPHVTVLFRRKPKFTMEDVRQLVAFRAAWLEDRGQPAKGGRCSFVANREWGKRSNLIDGDLCEFVLAAREALREQLGCSKEDERLPHVSVRR